MLLIAAPRAAPARVRVFYIHAEPAQRCHTPRMLRVLRATHSATLCWSPLKSASALLGAGDMLLMRLRELRRLMEARAED